MQIGLFLFSKCTHYVVISPPFGVAVFVLVSINKCSYCSCIAMLCIREIRTTHLVRKRPDVVLVHCHPGTWTIQAPPTNHDITT